MNLFILLGPLCLWGAFELVDSGRFGLFSILWWFLHVYLFRQPNRLGFSGYLEGLLRATPTWIPLGLSWAILPFARSGDWFPWDRQMAVAVLALLSAVLQSRSLPDRNDWIPRPLTFLTLVALLWLPFHIAKPAYELLNFKGTIDVMVFHSMASNLSQGQGLFVSFSHTAKQLLLHPGGHFLNGHFSPILYLVFAPYAWWPSVTYLVVFQAVALAGAAFSLFGLTAAATGNRFFALALSLSFLLHPMLQAVQYAWFHEVALAPFLVFTCFWLWIVRTNDAELRMGNKREETPVESKRLRFVLPSRLPLFVFLTIWILILGVKEDISVVLVFIGAAMILAYPRDRFLWILTVLSAAWVFWLMVWFLPSLFAEGKYGYFDRVSFGVDPATGPIDRLKEVVGMLQDRLLRSDKLRYLLHMGIPLGFLWIRGGWWLLPAAPVFAWIALSQSWLEYAFYPCQYPALPLTTLYLAAVGAARRIMHSNESNSRRSLNRWAYVILVSGVGFHFLLANARIPDWVSPAVWRHFTTVSQDAERLHQALAELPESATIWCDCSHGHFVKNPAMCKMIPWSLEDADPVTGSPFILILREDIPDYADWVKEILRDPENAPGWRLLHKNPLGNVFMRVDSEIVPSQG